MTNGRNSPLPLYKQMYTSTLESNLTTQSPWHNRNPSPAVLALRCCSGVVGVPALTGAVYSHKYPLGKGCKPTPGWRLGQLLASWRCASRQLSGKQPSPLGMWRPSPGFPQPNLHVGSTKTPLPIRGGGRIITSFDGVLLHAWGWALHLPRR